jgi:hypothetical protein
LQKPLLTLKVNQNLIENFTLIVHVILTGVIQANDFEVKNVQNKYTGAFHLGAKNISFGRK